jgi:hypothetical protein
VTFVLPLVLLPLGKHIAILKFLPANIEVNSLAAVKPVADTTVAIGSPLSAWAASGCCACTRLSRWRPAAGRSFAGTPDRAELAMMDGIRRVTVMLLRETLRAPFTRRAWRDVRFCATGAITGVAGFAVVAAVLVPALAISGSVVGAVIGLPLVVAAIGVARRLGAPPGADAGDR